MSEQHTSEPWRVGNPNGEGWESDNELIKEADPQHEGHRLVLGRMNCNFSELGKANARRIVACVNACAGIPTENLEAARMNDAFAEILRAAADRACDRQLCSVCDGRFTQEDCRCNDWLEWNAAIMGR